jgi:hypothetical protein
VTELLDVKVDVIVTVVTGNALAARRMTSTVPIVMLTSGYPVEAGLAASLGRPGGNVTGNSVYAGGELFGKYIEILSQIVPGMAKLAVFWDYADDRRGRRERGSKGGGASGTGVPVPRASARSADSGGVRSGAGNNRGRQARRPVRDIGANPRSAPGRIAACRNLIEASCPHVD